LCAVHFLEINHHIATGDDSMLFSILFEMSELGIPLPFPRKGYIIVLI
jgi:hypothetical protein